MCHATPSLTRVCPTSDMDAILIGHSAIPSLTARRPWRRTAFPNVAHAATWGSLLPQPPLSPKEKSDVANRPPAADLLFVRPEVRAGMSALIGKG